MQLTVPTEQGQTRQVTVAHVQRGLAVQEPRAGTDEDWGVVHVPSGRLVSPLAFPTKAQARACQQALLALGIDWTQPYSAFQTRAMRPLLRAADALIQQHLGRPREATPSRQKATMAPGYADGAMECREEEA